VNDLDGGDYEPTFDDSNMINGESVDRATESGTQSTQSFINAASQGTYGQLVTSETTYTTTDADALHLAQYDVASRSTPGFRLPKVTFDLATATTAGLADAHASVRIGSRARVTGLYAAAAPSTQLDVLVEGIAESIDEGSYVVSYDASPADNPAAMILDDAAYGRLQCQGQTLNAALTAAATTVVIATSVGNATFTTVSARYPMNIRVEQEIVTLTAAPGGSTSPQTFTGVLRGQQGTPASAQASGAAVNLWPAATLAL